MTSVQDEYKREAAGGKQPLPDYTGVDLDELAARTTRPVLGAVLAGLRRRAGRAEQAVAYHEDSPGISPD
ncbi:hypothetical protein NGB36_06925 [Streptomyces sp. RB6PN25]|uniref:FXSXX-COOH protein n=1 Tax=Streptomyces humicola TaxID=2953240 RepID=A0ABT1PTQ2_9ACTN|nr:YxD-tail cyclophane-containing RiPP peptide [Streptomyces humicola]MCQ4080335.1 hypothetical protein [Streptomyces humicola]